MQTLDLIRSRSLEALRPPADMATADWIEANVHLPQTASALPGRMKLWAYQRGICDAMDDPDIERVTVMKSARIGYTALLSGVIASYVSNSPAPILAVQPTADDARDFAVDLEQTFEASPSLRGLMSDAHLHLALTLALWTGQRQGDLLRLTWTAYDGTSIRLKQQKTGARVALPVGAPLKAALDRAKASKKDAVTILTTEAGTSWTESGFRASWRKACVKAGVSGVTFHDLRGTAVTRLALAGCSEAEIATITGHSLRDVGAILDAHYLKRDGGLAESAIRKLETRTKTPN